MILMSVVVLVLSYQRFDVLVRRARSSVGAYEGDRISLTSSLGTALSLGVSNLKKRPMRLILTAFTVTVLTFSIITFVSVEGRDELARKEVPMDIDVEGVKLDPGEVERPQYDGVLFRMFFWTDLDARFVSAVYSEFGGEFDVTTRGCYIQSRGGNNADREGINQVQVSRGGRKSMVTAIMTMMPNERKFTGFNRAVEPLQQWFKPEDRMTIVIPDNLAEDLEIKPGDLLNADGTLKSRDQLPTVLIDNREWTVLGILDTSHADRIRDVSGKSLAIVDFLRSAFNPSAASDKMDLLTEPPSYHISWDKLVVIPHAVADQVQAKPISLAVRFGDASRERIERFYDDVALRLTHTMFGTITEPGEEQSRSYLISTQARASVGGLAKIVVPVILCILIVMNTMIGNVEERKGEVGMLGAVGLSPAQIAFLLLSESLVFSIMGIVFGTFGGLVFANIIPGIQSVWPTFLQGLSLNFTSLSSMLLACGTGVIVLIATLIPARRAARLAAPSGMANWQLPDPVGEGEIDFILPFTLTRGNAVGMIAFFRRFLLSHTDATSEGFNCRDIEVFEHKGDTPALAIQARMWLAPYDLDVAQEFEMRIQPTATEGIFEVRIRLLRTSGSEEAWLRTNYGFLDEVRRQFLLWRNLEGETRQRFVSEGVGLFQQVNDYVLA
jgi:hypothetical protein